MVPKFPNAKGDHIASVSQVQKLQGILKPMMLRRLKEDVEKNLAPKEETIIEVGPRSLQMMSQNSMLVCVLVICYPFQT